MCRFFNVSRSGYYDYLKRMDAPNRDAELVKTISACQNRVRNTYGYRRVHLWLIKQGIDRNPKTVLRVMQKHGLLSQIRRRVKYRYMGEHLHKYPNLLNRIFIADQPNQKWVTDISYIYTGEGVLYLSMIRDLYDNSIVSYKVSTKQSTGGWYLIPQGLPKKKKKLLQSYSSTVTRGFSIPQKHTIH